MKKSVSCMGRMRLQYASLMIPALVSFLTDRLRAQGAQTEVVQTHCVPFPGALNT